MQNNQGQSVKENEMNFLPYYDNSNQFMNLNDQTLYNFGPYNHNLYQSYSTSSVSHENRNLNKNPQLISISGISPLQQILRNYEKENNSEDIFEPFFEIYEKNPKLFEIEQQQQQQLNEQISSQSDLTFGDCGKRQEEGQEEQEEEKEFLKQDKCGIYNCQYNEYNDQNQIQAYSSYNANQNHDTTQQQQSQNQKLDISQNINIQENQKQQQQLLLLESNTKNSVNKKRKLNESQENVSKQVNKKQSSLKDQDDEDDEDEYSEYLYETKKQRKLNSSSNNNSKKNQNQKKIQQQQQQQQPQQQQQQQSQNKQKVQDNNNNNNTKVAKKLKLKKNKSNVSCSSFSDNVYSFQGCLTQQELKRQIKITRKNLWKNIGRQFFQHIQKDKRGGKIVLEKFGIENPDDFLSKYTPKTMKILNKEQFLKFFYPQIPNQLDEQQVLSKRGKNLTEQEEQFLHRKILRVMVYKFVKEQLYQHCTQESRIKNWCCFLSQKYYFLYSLVRINKKDLLPQE